LAANEDGFAIGGVLVPVTSPPTPDGIDKRLG